MLTDKHCGTLTHFQYVCEHHSRATEMGKPCLSLINTEDFWIKPFICIKDFVGQSFKYIYIYKIMLQDICT